MPVLYCLFVLLYISVATESQSGDLDDPPTHWLGPSDLDDSPTHWLGPSDPDDDPNKKIKT